LERLKTEVASLDPWGAALKGAGTTAGSALENIGKMASVVDSEHTALKEPSEKLSWQVESRDVAPSDLADDAGEVKEVSW
jgi:hypothetical protein